MDKSKEELKEEQMKRDAIRKQKEKLLHIEEDEVKQESKQKLY